MKLKKLTIILLAVAVLAGGLASYGARNYITQSIADYRAKLEGEYEKVRVAVAARDLPAGRELARGSVATRHVPKAFLHKDAITEAEWKRYAGRTSRSLLSAGAPILKSQLVNPDTGVLSESLEPGKRALTVPVDQISSISGLLAPGDHIDMLLTVNTKDRDQTFPLLKEIPVLATGIETDTTEKSVAVSDRRAKRPFNTVTVLVDPEQAAKIVHAREVGSLTVVLRAEDDRSDGWPDQVTLASLIGEPPVVKKKTIKRRKIQVILGGSGRIR